MMEKPVLPRWTWFLPPLIFHLGTILSLEFRISPDMPLWYLPVPLGMILIHWWGPRVLVGLYLNAMLCAGYWGFQRWELWPLYAIPETLKVALSWWMFNRMLKGKPWLPDLPHTWKFLLFGIIVPCGAATLIGQAMLTLTGDLAPGNLLQGAYAGFVLEIPGPFALTVPVLLFATSWMEKRRLSLTQGAFPRPALIPTAGPARAVACQAAAVALALLALSLSPLFRSPDSAAWLSREELLKINMILATLGFAALIVGRALSDLYLEIERRAKVEEDLRKSISEWNRTERALSESEERFRQMAENIQEVFFLLDSAAEKILYLSPLAKTILGMPVSDMASRPMSFFDRMHHEDAERIGFYRDGAWRKRSFNEDFRFIRPDGETRWLRLRSFLIRKGGVDGDVFRVAGVIGDITEYKRAQEEARAHQQRLVQSDKMNSLGQMVSGVAHEVNNPNNLIMLNADVMETFWRHMRPVLREHFAANPDWKMAGIPYGVAEGKFETLLGGVSGGAKRIKRIVDNLKDFARIDGGDLSESVSVEKVVEASVGIVENLIRKSTDRFSISNGGSLPRIRGNFQKLEQVVINLVTNACQALESRSKAIRIMIWHEEEAGMVAIRVEDEGRGIPAGLLNKVADPFFTTKRDTGGTGLGLSVSYGIVREHRGRIEYTSDEQRGTTVEIRFPTIKETA